MFIPVNYKVKFKEYPDAPKATSRSKLLGHITAWPWVLLTGLQVWDVFRDIIILHFNGENPAASSLAAIATLFVYGLLMNFKTFLSGIIDNQAVLEASANKFSAYDAKVMSLREDTEAKILKAAIVLIALGCTFAALTMCIIPRDADDFRDSVPHNQKSNRIYLAKWFYVLGGYAHDTNSGHVYYIAAIGSSGGDEVYLFSFDPGEKSKARTKIDECGDSKPCILSAYVRISELDSSLSEFYDEATTRITDSKALRMSAEYICSDGENIMLHSIGEKEAFRFVLAAILIITGLYFMKGAKNS